MTDIRHIYPINISELKPNQPVTGQPIFEDLDPATLFVDGSYQRDVGERGIKQIRRMIENWDWRKFEPPACCYSEDDEGKTIIKVLDGQHTAIAAASHPHIKTIPCMIVEAADVQDQAKAFIGQNTDRLGVTKLQLHQAALIAGDEDALTIQQVCDRAGVQLVLANNGRYGPGDTVAISAISALVGKYSAMSARKMLETLAKAELAPILTPHIKAVEHLMTAAEFTDTFDPEELTAAVKQHFQTCEQEAKLFAISHRVPLWKATAISWYKKTKKRRQPAKVAA